MPHAQSWPSSNLVRFAFLFAVAWPLSGKAADASVKIDVSAQSPTLRPGEHAEVSIRATIPEGYHLYSMTPIPEGPLTLKIASESPALKQVGHWHAPQPHVEFDQNFAKEVEFFEKEVTHLAAFVVTADANAGALAADYVVRGQICNPAQCVPFKEKATLNLTIEAGPARDEFAKAPTLAGESFGPERKPPVSSAAKGDTSAATQAGSPLGQDLWGFVVIAFLAGLSALVTPCVFPMIPITVSFFSKFAKVSLRRAVMMATIYAVSIIGTFTLLGVAISVIFGALGMQTLSSSPGFNIFLATLLIVFAFNLFGLFEIQVPSWLISRTSQKEHELKKGDGSLARQAAGVFFMALTFTLVSFTCTVGFVGVVLAEASKGNWFYPAIGMFAFSVAFSLPFFLFAIFPSWADKLKGKAGDWMIAVKATLGFLELAGASKFLSNVDLIWQAEVVTRPLVLAAWSGIFFTCGLFLLRIFGLPHSDNDSKTVGPVRMAFGMVMLSLAVYSYSGISHTKSMGGWMDAMLPPAVYPGQSAGSDGDEHHLSFMVDDIPGAVEKGRAENRPVFVDYTGYACTNCRYMEASVFPRPEIRSKLEEMVRISAYTDCEKPICEEQRESQLKRFDTAALPFYVVLDPYDDAVLATFADMTREPKLYAEFLQKGLDAFTAKHGAIGKAAAPQSSVVAAAASAVPAPKLVASGKPVNFKFNGLADKKPFSLDSMRGEWVFVNFWASWCGPCKEELEHVFPKVLSQAPHIKMVSVAFDGDETREAALSFAKKIDLLRHPTLQGGDDIEAAGLPAEFEVSSDLPLSYLIDPQGHVAWKHRGALSAEALAATFSAAKSQG
jgi:thiol:disulfide interchange protein DsbD